MKIVKKNNLYCIQNVKMQMLATFEIICFFEVIISTFEAVSNLEPRFVDKPKLEVLS